MATAPFSNVIVFVSPLWVILQSALKVPALKVYEFIPLTTGTFRTTVFSASNPLFSFILNKLTATAKRVKLMTRDLY